MLPLHAVAQIYPAALRTDRVLEGVATVGGHAVAYSVPVDAYVLSSLSGDIDPFYHASGLLFTVPSVTVDSMVSVRLRIAAECWNFSAAYQSAENTYLWAKPSVVLSLPVSAVIDSVRVTAGDLWRVRIGQGLALDQFESFGSNVRLVVGKVGIEATTIGYGWTGADDIYALAVQYDSTVRLNGFMNFGGSFPNAVRNGTGHYLISVDAQLRRGPIRVYAEAGVAQGEFAALCGFDAVYHTATTHCELHVEARTYPVGFFPSSTTTGGYPSNPYPYINSLTALDKPVMTYRSFVGRRQGFGFRLIARQVITGPLIIGTDTEYFRNFYSDTYLGITLRNRAEFTVGYLNKVFRLYEYGAFESMFGRQSMVLFRARLCL